MSLLPTDEEIKTKARELADKEGLGWAAIEAEESSDRGGETKSYWLKKAEEALKAERRNAL
jgi:RecB family endonuclease NucS